MKIAWEHWVQGLQANPPHPGPPSALGTLRYRGHLLNLFPSMVNIGKLPCFLAV